MKTQTLFTGYALSGLHSLRSLFIGLLAMLAVAATFQGQGQRGAAPPPPPAGPPPKALIPNAKPVRTCESLAAVALPNTTIESAAVDPMNPGICRVTAITTHPPAGDKVKIWLAIPTANWNGRFMGTGGGGFVGGNATGVNQPAAQGYAAGATDTGHDGGSGSFAICPTSYPIVGERILRKCEADVEFTNAAIANSSVLFFARIAGPLWPKTYPAGEYLNDDSPDVINPQVSDS